MTNCAASEATSTDAHPIKRLYPLVLHFKTATLPNPKTPAGGWRREHLLSHATELVMRLRTNVSHKRTVKRGSVPTPQSAIQRPRTPRQCAQRLATEVQSRSRRPHAIEHDDDRKTRWRPQERSPISLRYRSSTLHPDPQSSLSRFGNFGLRTARIERCDTANLGPVVPRSGSIGQIIRTNLDKLSLNRKIMNLNY